MNLGERGYLQGRGDLVIECITGTKHTRNDLTQLHHVTILRTAPVLLKEVVGQFVDSVSMELQPTLTTHYRNTTSLPGMQSFPH